MEKYLDSLKQIKTSSNDAEEFWTWSQGVLTVAIHDETITNNGFDVLLNERNIIYNELRR